uniref:Uncharacterized protein n=1 Tax=Arundo donax TaxID=35708 RepID=A0A0A8YG01_ARUDO
MDHIFTTRRPCLLVNGVWLLTLMQPEDLVPWCIVYTFSYLCF